MLASMQSIALARAAAPPFNGLFYATMATVIPVLFVAAAVQGRTYQEMLKESSRRYAVSIWQGNDPITLRKAVRSGSLTRSQAIREWVDLRDWLSWVPTTRTWTLRATTSADLAASGLSACTSSPRRIAVSVRHEPSGDQAGIGARSADLARQRRPAIIT